MIVIFTLITRQDSPKKLTQTSINSVFKQTYVPDHILLIKDYYCQYPHDIHSLETDIPNHIPLTYLKNSRTIGYSGTLNTGVSFILDNFSYDPKNIYISMITDHFKWSENHIKNCLHYIRKNKDVIISETIYNNNCKIQNNVNTLIINDILTCQQNVYPSNICIRLSSLLEAGLFDESLHTLIIEDLYMRLSEINAKIVTTNTPTVYQYADYGIDSYSEIEKLSIQKFFQKYQYNMTFSQKQAFQKFNCLTDKKNVIPINNIKDYNYKRIAFNLVIGIISNKAEQLNYLIDDIWLIKSFPFIESLKILILANGDEYSLINLSAKTNENGLPCEVISQSQQEKDALNGGFGIRFNRGCKVVSIAKARTMLQRYLYEFVKNSKNTIVWILDDDMRLNVEKTEKYLSTLPQFKNQGVDVLIGTFEGASPNPSTSGIRVQLVDLLYNLKWLNSMDNNSPLPDRYVENRNLRMNFPDYYYDLSRMHTAHLEAVYWLTPNCKGETVGQSKEYLFSNLIKLFIGSSILRPLIVDLPINPLDEAEDSVNRGGNTFVLNSKTLKMTPNAIITISGREIRRSDMLWALINRYYYNFKIKKVNFPVIHNRCVFSEAKMSVKKTIEEIQGSSIHAALKDFFKKQCDNKKANLIFDNNMITTICITANQYLSKRLSSFQLNFYRIQGLCKALKQIDTENNLEYFLNELSSFYVDNVLNSIKNRVHELSCDQITNFLNELKPQIDSYASSKIDIKFMNS